MKQWQNSNYKTRIRILSAVFFIALMWIYVSFIKDALQIRSEVHEMRLAKSRISDAPELKLRYQKELNKLNSYLAPDSGDLISGEQRIMDFISKQANERNFVLVDFPKANYHEEAGISIQTNSLKVEGKFKDLLELVYTIERTQKYAVVASTSFLVNKNVATGKRKLIASLYLRTINNYYYDKHN